MNFGKEQLEDVILGYLLERLGVAGSYDEYMLVQKRCVSKRRTPQEIQISRVDVRPE